MATCAWYMFLQWRTNNMLAIGTFHVVSRDIVQTMRVSYRSYITGHLNVNEGHVSNKGFLDLTPTITFTPMHPFSLRYILISSQLLFIYEDHDRCHNRDYTFISISWKKHIWLQICLTYVAPNNKKDMEKAALSGAHLSHYAKMS